MSVGKKSIATSKGRGHLSAGARDLDLPLANTKVSVVGGGVAGLAASIALRQGGASVALHERAAEFAEVGAGLQISPNGMRAAAALGLGEAIRSMAIRSAGIRLVDALSNRVIVEMSNVGPRYFIHRARLVDVLARAASRAGVEFSMGSQRATDDLEGDLVVGADGVRSAFRAVLNPGAEAGYSGQVAWRAVIKDPGAPPVAEVYLGPGRHLITYPLASGLRNIVAAEDRRDWTAEGWAIEDRPLNLRSAFARFPMHVQSWLEQVEKVHLWGLHVHPVAERWHDGRCVLVGDAAHPTLPYLAQGANLALEDAVMLARAVSGPGLAAYEATRRPRAQRIVAAAEANAWRFHISNPILRLTAFTGLRLRERIRPGAAGSGFDYIWDYDPAAAPLDVVE